MVIIPKRLQYGDKIGIVSPSGPILPTTKLQLEKGIKFLKGLGFDVVLGKNALKIDEFSSGTPEERAEDLHSMFADKEIKAILCSQGGNVANSILPLLKWNIIKRNPKIFMGLSDITTLLNPISSKTGLVTFHGNDVMWGFGRDPTAYDKKEFVDRLVNGKIGKVSKNSSWKTIRGGIAEGILMGGNVHCISKLAGTKYFPDFSNSILFLEAYRIKPENCYEIFYQFEQLGIFNKIKGMIIGYIYGLQAKPKSAIQMEDVLSKVTKEYGYDFPIIKSDDFGHNCPNTVLPIGVKARINADKKELEILSECVK